MRFQNILGEIVEDEKDNREKVEELKEPIQRENSLFDISLFYDEMSNFSEKKNKEYIKHSENITAYDINRCARQVIYRITGKEVESYADKWLPILMRSTIGTAIHRFIQKSKQFSEIEVKVKVPSLRFSGVIDCLIGNSTIVEIKSCSYLDYRKIIKSQRPRESDFYQALVYKYMLENHLDEIKEINPKIDYDKYNIKNLQFIYVAHDLISSDVGSIEESLEIIRELKKKLNSKDNLFYFISSLIIDSDQIHKEHENYIISKINDINLHLKNNTIPDKDNQFIKQTDCYFCLYNNVCEIAKK